MSINRGVLYIVATPLGNLGDLSPRAVEVLSGVNLIATEDTRHSAPLLRHFNIRTACLALHEHNERQAAAKILERLSKGDSVALISDAGTPLISDPGYHLVQAARAQGVRVTPIPGPCALITALSASGLPSDRFVFEGFLPVRSGARRARLTELRDETRTLIFYESPHRILDCIADMVQVFGTQRCAVIARELTKLFETIHEDTLSGLAGWLRSDENQQRGEFVILLHGSILGDSSKSETEAQRIVRILMAELPVKQAAALTAHITGLKKNALYDYAVRLKDFKPDDA